MTISTEDIQRIHAEHVARGLTPAECVQGTRTAVHALVQAETPLAASSLTPEMQAERDAREPLTHAQKAAHLAHQRSQVTPEQHEAYGRAKGAGDRSARNCADAHHWVQMLHQTAMWKEADRLVAEAGVK